MTALLSVEVVSRVARKAAERKYWRQEAADLLILKGVCGPDELEQAAEYAESLMYRNVDDRGELTASPKEAVDDDLIYPYATMS
jgi:hypothetical protein